MGLHIYVPCLAIAQMAGKCLVSLMILVMMAATIIRILIMVLSNVGAHQSNESVCLQDEVVFSF